MRDLQKAKCCRGCYETTAIRRRKGWLRTNAGRVLRILLSARTAEGGEIEDKKPMNDGNKYRIPGTEEH
jgi:hypothetical protein